MLSIWEKQSFLKYDVLIIGGGIVGISTAISLKEKNPTKRILILERGILPAGASTKNAGFACIGSLTELLDDLQTMTEQEVIDLVQMRYEGLNKLRRRLGDNTLDYRELGSYELISESELPCLNKIDRINSLLLPHFHKPVFELANEKTAEFGFNKQFTKALIQNNFEGQLDSGKMMRALIDLALNKGIEIKTGCEVSRFEETNEGVTIYSPHSYLKEEIAFYADKLILCTNAFTSPFIPDIDIQPGRGQVLVTKPVHNLPFKGIFHFDKGYYYFRNYGNRIIFGGARNLDFETEHTTAFEYNNRILKDLQEKLIEIILPKTSFEIDYTWTGIMAFGSKKFPILTQQSKSVFIGVRLGGMGVAIGTELGERLAIMVTID